ncbi:LADA_0A04346g1_1 [Lachancea dasiensis]|uniref:LADA_0A04346g1_1 n=1 Tax=Lachancea dasiensis TaxID=1072105 RepID=A0A1G4INK7_9SACH|nr:LADA_0A04346g1_1 [Lachancea dasiensis]
MPRFFCDYCHSYLTHDTPSVKKSHLLGKNHVRLAGDYYCNKARQVAQQFFPRTRKTDTRHVQNGKDVNRISHRKIPLHCATNRQKKMARRNNAIRAQELSAKIQVLDKLYGKSPGYAKVFKPECRLDTGQSVRLDRAPQRANRKPNHTDVPGSRGFGGGSATAALSVRNQKFRPDYTSARSLALLPPPPSLSQWPTCPPLLLASDRATATTLRDATHRLERH